MRIEDWLEREQKTQDDFAVLVGVDQATISRLIARNGLRQRRRPSLGLMEKILVATGGAVQPNDFVDQEYECLVEDQPTSMSTAA